MKKFSVTLVVLIGILAVVSCDNPSSPGGGTGQEGDLPGEGAYVRIMLPSYENSRSISLDKAKQLTNFYFVTFKRTDTPTPEYFSEGASSSDGYIELRVPVGQYDILLFAGIARGTPMLLASAYKQGQDILLAGINIINLNLKLVEFEIDVPALVEPGGDFEVIARLNFHNPLIDFSDGRLVVMYNTVGGDENNWEGATVENPSYIPSTGDYIFTSSLVAGSDNGEWQLWSNLSPIKPFWGVDWYFTDGRNDGNDGVGFFTFFEVKVPEINVSILWPTE